MKRSTHYKTKRLTFREELIVAVLPELIRIRVATAQRVFAGTKAIPNALKDAMDDAFDIAYEVDKRERTK